ncbi:MAG: rRNA maturation RNase YbeY [Magnetovibrio sp.]|nr:rRNA maturation RNase YbeY [Magnetovibrio sp.]
MNTATILALEVAVVANGWCKAVTAPEEVAKRAARAAYSAGSLDLGRSCEAAVVLTDDDRVRLLNRDYRNKDRATNVLSFPAFDADDMARLPVDAPLFLGDIFIALETATAEARLEAKTTTDHLSHLVVHGMLHLLGHDHETDDEATIMERLEADALAQLGVPDPYVLANEAAAP